jgi:gamma-butyrobetaine dioxygenase
VGIDVSLLEGGRLVVVDDEQLASAWLRDACHCPACRHPRTNERLLDSRSISPDLTATSTRIDGQFLCVELSDGHLARVPLALVLDPARRGRPAQPMAGRTVTATDTIWSCDARSLELDHGVGELCDRLWSDGVVLVTGVEPTENGLRGVAERIGHIEPTNFGAIWSIDASPEPDSAVDSVRGLRARNRLPFGPIDQWSRVPTSLSACRRTS